MGFRRFDLDAGGESFAFTRDTEPKISFWLSKFPEDRQRSAVIPLLWLAQKDNGGWLSEPAMREVADRLGMPYIRVYEVATFYTMFRLAPVGAHHVTICGTTPCRLRGAERLIAMAEREIGPRMQPTDDGRLSWEEVECLGACVNAPMAQIDDDYYEDLDEKSFAHILGALRNGLDVDAGPQTDRVNSEAEGGSALLTEPSLFDGSRNAIAGLPGVRVDEAPDEVTEPGDAEPAAHPPATDPTNTERPGKGKATLLDTVKSTDGLSGSKPEIASVPEGERDNLQLIKGIGKVNEAELHRLGIHTFKQIAAWSPENVSWVESYMSFPGRISREDWIAQAKALAGDDVGA